jgi:hypothetical protein
VATALESGSSRRRHDAPGRSGATVIDTSDLDPDATLAAAVAVVRQRAPELVP